MAETSASGDLTVADLVFVGFNSRAAALRRDTGDIVWQWKARKGSGFVAVLLDGENVVLSVHGYTYSLDALSGKEQWMNPMTGFGMGVPCLTSFRSSSLGASLLAQSEADASTSSASAAAH